jgi:hypothetical protein
MGKDKVSLPPSERHYFKRWGMKFRGLMVAAIAVFGFALLMDSSNQSQGGDKKDPVAIKVVMQKAMKGGLCGKVASGKASDEEVATLISLFTDLAANKCPKGDEASWKKRTEALVKGAKAAKEDGGKSLKKAADCKGCHSEHK